MIIGHLLLPLNAQALPEGYSTSAGDVSFSQSQSNTLNITSSSHRAIVNYQKFNIGKGETVNFNLPSSQSAILNRVIGGEPSRIFGAMNANGRVFLINPSGILFGNSAQVNLPSLVASTLNIRDEDFLGGHYHFYNPPGTDPATIRNEGMIQVMHGGSLLFVASAIENYGTISAPKGQIYLAAGNNVTVEMDNYLLLGLAVTPSATEQSQQIVNTITNQGVLNAPGGTVQMQFKSEAELFAIATNLDGVIQADEFILNGDEIDLVAIQQSSSINQIAGQPPPQPNPPSEANPPPDNDDTDQKTSQQGAPHGQPSEVEGRASPDNKTSENPSDTSSFSVSSLEDPVLFTAFAQDTDETANDTVSSSPLNTLSTKTASKLQNSLINLSFLNQLVHSAWTTSPTYINFKKLGVFQTNRHLGSLAQQAVNISQSEIPGSVAGSAAPMDDFEFTSDENGATDDGSFYVVLFENQEGQIEMRPVRPKPSD